MATKFKIGDKVISKKSNDIYIILDIDIKWTLYSLSRKKEEKYSSAACTVALRHLTPLEQLI